MAIEKLTTGNEPPWVWYQLMKLREASEALVAYAAHGRFTGTGTVAGCRSPTSGSKRSARNRSTPSRYDIDTAGHVV
jgi:hypothetical protein